MSPFRERPPIELGPLDVGLERAAEKARRGIPNGGRLVTLRSSRLAAHTAGALGSAGVLSVVTIAFVAWISRWSPARGVDLLLCAAAVAIGGLSLAAVLHAIDRRSGVRIESAHVIGGRARCIVRRLARLAARARKDPSRFGTRRIRGLIRALDAANEPEIARWIPADVRGRAELLLARALSAHAGTGWSSRSQVRERVRELLEGSAERLGDPAPALADLSLLPERGPAPTRRAAQVVSDAEEDEETADPALNRFATR